MASTWASVKDSDLAVDKIPMEGWFLESSEHEEHEGRKDMKGPEGIEAITCRTRNSRRWKGYSARDRRADL
jgi:hypothetical protein